MSQELEQLDEQTLSRAARSADMAAHACETAEAYADLIHYRDALRDELRRRLVRSCINLRAGGAL